MEGFARSKSAMSFAWLGGPHSSTHHPSHLISTCEADPAAPYGGTVNAMRKMNASRAAVHRDNLVRICVPPSQPGHAGRWSALLSSRNVAGLRSVLRRTLLGVVVLTLPRVLPPSAGQSTPPLSANIGVTEDPAIVHATRG